MWKLQLLSSKTPEKFIQKCLKQIFKYSCWRKKEKSFYDNDGHVPLLKTFKYFMLLTYAAPKTIILLIWLLTEVNLHQLHQCQWTHYTLLEYRNIHQVINLIEIT